MYFRNLPVPNFIVLWPTYSNRKIMYIIHIYATHLQPLLMYQKKLRNIVFQNFRLGCFHWNSFYANKKSYGFDDCFFTILKNNFFFLYFKNQIFFNARQEKTKKCTISTNSRLPITNNKYGKSKNFINMTWIPFFSPDCSYSFI